MPLWMNGGKVNLSNGSRNVVGVGTKFLDSPAPARQGQILIVNNLLFEVESVATNTSLTLAAPYPGATANNVSYSIVTTMDGSYSDLARRAAQVMALYQGYMDVFNDLFTKSGTIEARLPDGSLVNLPSWSQIDSQVVRKSEVVGPVYESGGVNAAAVIEVGSNANGSFVKFAGGGLEALASIDLSGFSVATPTGAIFQSSLEVRVNLPAVFVGGLRPYVVVQYSGGGARPWASVSNLGSSFVSFVLHSPLSMSAFSGRLLVGVIGRWY